MPPSETQGPSSPCAESPFLSHPADIKKTGPSYDLPIAIGILVCSGQIPDSVSKSLFLGELSLDGKLRTTHGMLPMLRAGKDKGYETAFVPRVNAREASLVPGIQISSGGKLEAGRRAPKGRCRDADDTGRWNTRYS